MYQRLTSPVLVNPYKSARADFIPKSGVLNVDETGLLTITETSSNKIVLQKQITDLNAIVSYGGKFRTKINVPTVLIYVGPNEAYEISFGSKHSAVKGALNIYDELLKGNLKGATQEFNTANPGEFTKEQIQQALKDTNKNYLCFIAIAKQAHVFKPLHKSFPFAALIFLIVFTALLLILLVNLSLTTEFHSST